MNRQARLVEVGPKVMKQNDLLARALRERFCEAGVYVVSLVSSPGSGKTAFLERSLTALRPLCRVAALVGDIATDNDAARLARSQVPVRQITTGTVCHLDAEMRESALAGWDLDELDILFIENVANEGKLIAIVAAEIADAIIAGLRKHHYGRDACIIGEVKAEPRGIVVRETSFGGARIVDMLVGEQAPRIC
jgi:hydrogenase accessory protein HypB